MNEKIEPGKTLKMSWKELIFFLSLFALVSSREEREAFRFPDKREAAKSNAGVAQFIKVKTYFVYSDEQLKKLYCTIEETVLYICRLLHFLIKGRIFELTIHIFYILYPQYCRVSNKTFSGYFSNFV